MKVHALKIVRLHTVLIVLEKNHKNSKKNVGYLSQMDYKVTVW